MFVYLYCLILSTINRHARGLVRLCFIDSSSAPSWQRASRQMALGPLTSGVDYMASVPWTYSELVDRALYHLNSKSYHLLTIF